MKKIKLFVLVALIFINAISVFAIGVTPGKIVIDFQPLLTKSFSIIVLNNEKKEFIAKVSIEGELNNTIACNSKEIYFSKNDTSKILKCEIKLPEIIEKEGKNLAFVRITEVQRPTGLITGGVSLLTKIVVFVPYKEENISIEDIKVIENDDVKFLIPVRNTCKKDLEVYAELFFEELDKEIKTKKIEIPPMKRDVLKVSWKDKKKGNYTLTVKIFYDGKETELKKTIEIKNDVILEKEEKNKISLIRPVLMGSGICIFLLLFLLWRKFNKSKK